MIKINIPQAPIDAYKQEVARIIAGVNMLDTWSRQLQFIVADDINWDYVRHMERISQQLECLLNTLKPGAKIADKNEPHVPS